VSRVAKLCPARLGWWKFLCDLNLNSMCPGQEAQGGQTPARTWSRSSDFSETVFVFSVAGKD